MANPAETDLSTSREKKRKSNFFHFLAQSYAVNTVNSKSNIRAALTQEKAKEKKISEKNPKSIEREREKKEVSSRSINHT